MPHSSDLDPLLLRFRASRDPEDFARLFDAAAPALFQLAVRLTRNGAVAEDVVQETFLAVLNGIEGWDPTRPAKPWLNGIAQRKAADAWRKGERARRSPPSFEGPNRDPGDEAGLREERDLVRDALDRLEEPYRRVAALRWRYGLEPGEIADALGENPATVRSLLHRAKARLEGRLRPAMLPAFLLAVPTARGLESVRAEVLSAAKGLAVTGTAASVTALTLSSLGGLLMAKKVVIATVVLLVLAIGAGVMVLDRDEPAPVEDAERVADTPPTDPDESEPNPEPEATQPTLPDPVDLARVDRDLDLHGRVMSDIGAPIGGATLTVVRYPWRRAKVLSIELHDQAKPVADARTAVDGTYAIRLRRGALVTLQVEAAGFVSRTIPDVQAGARVDVVLSANGVDLIVIVTAPDDAPVEGARVRLRSLKQSEVDAVAETDVDGRATFGPLPPELMLLASVEESDHGAPSWIRIQLPASGEHVRTIRLPVGTTITGTVTDGDTGAPIEGAAIGMSWVQERAVRSGPDGRYALPGWTAKGTEEIAITAEGYGRERARVEGRDVIDVVLRRADTVIGRVVGPDGRPVVGAPVSAVSSRQDHDGQIASFGHDVSDDDGRFRITSLRRDMVHSLVVTADGLGRTLVDFDPNPGGPGTVDLGDVHLVAGRAIEGVVLDTDDQPVAGAEVTLVGENADRAQRRGKPSPDFRYGRTERRITDDLGRFRFPDLAPGHYEITSRPAGSRAGSVAVDLGAVDALDVVLPIPIGRELTVTVLGVDGKPMKGILVAAMGTPGTQTTDASGVCRFTFDGAMQRRLHVFTRMRLADDVLPPEPQTVGSDVTEVTLRFRRGGLLRALVLDPSGEPVPKGIEVRVVNEGKGREFALTDASGRIATKVEGDPTVDLIVGGKVWGEQGFTGVRRPIRGEARQVRAGGDEIVIRCEKAPLDRSITVRVVDPDGNPLSGLVVWSFDGGIPHDPERVTDANGTTTLSGLPNDDCTFMVSGKKGPLLDDWVAPVHQRVRPAGQTITMATRVAATVTGVLVDADGKGVTGGVTARLADGSAIGAASDAEGRFTLRVPADAPPFTITAHWVAGGTIRSASLEGVRPGTEVRVEER